MKKMESVNSSLHLDVNYIGGQGSLTYAEEKALSKFFKQRKENSKGADRNSDSKRLGKSCIFVKNDSV